MITRFFLVLTVLVAIVALMTPACAVVFDPRSGTPAPTIHQPTQQELNEQMKGPKVKPPTGPVEAQTSVTGPELPSDDPQAILAVTTGPKQSELQPNAHGNGQESGNTQLGLAITCGLLGLFAFAGMLAVRKLPKMPTSIAYSHYPEEYSEELEI